MNGNITGNKAESFNVLENVEKSGVFSGPIFKRIGDYLCFFAATIGFDLVFVLFMTTLLVVTVWLLDGHIRFFQASIILPLGIMAAAVIIKSIQIPAKALKNSIIILRDWIPFLFIAFIYENLHDIAGRIDHYDVARYMFHWDGLLFGIQPTIWAQHLFNPLFTDIMSISYASYFTLPLAIMFFLSLAGERNLFRSMVLCISFTFVIGFICYTFFPCSPPRYFMESMYTNPHTLTGFFLYNKLQGMWDGLSVISGGAFPSLHVGISTVALIYAYKYRKISKLNKVIWYLYIPLVTSLWFSTVYLRHHWVVDIIAGWLVAIGSYFLAERLLKIWLHMRKRFSIS